MNAYNEVKSTTIKLCNTQFPQPSPKLPSPWSLETNNLSSFPIVLPFPECPMSRLLQCVAFWVWLPSRNMMHLCIICAECTEACSLLLQSRILLYDLLLLLYLSPVEGHSGCFPFLMMMTKAVVNTAMQVCVEAQDGLLGRMSVCLQAVLPAWLFHQQDESPTSSPDS